MQFGLSNEHWKYKQILERQMIQRFLNGKKIKARMIGISEERMSL